MEINAKKYCEPFEVINGELHWTCLGGKYLIPESLLKRGRFEQYTFVVSESTLTSPDIDCSCNEHGDEYFYVCPGTMCRDHFSMEMYEEILKTIHSDIPYRTVGYADLSTRFYANGVEVRRGRQLTATVCWRFLPVYS